MIAGLIRLITGVQSHWLDEPLAAESETRCVYFANHSSNLDAIVIWAALPASLRAQTRPVAADDYWGHSPLKKYLALNVFNALLIEREKVTVRNNPMPKLHEALQRCSLIIFPEGGRHRADDDMSPFKSGLFRLARDNPSVRLVPVHLHNLNRVLPKGDFLPIPLLSRVTFGKAIQLNPDEDKHAFLDRARLAVAQLAETAEGA